MKAVVIGTGRGASMDEIMAVYPRHKAFVVELIARGDVVGIGPFTDGGGGNLAIFPSRKAAERFAAEDPFVLEGLLKGYEIRLWGDEILK